VCSAARAAAVNGGGRATDNTYTMRRLLGTAALFALGASGCGAAGAPDTAPDKVAALNACLRTAAAAAPETGAGELPATLRRLETCMAQNGLPGRAGVDGAGTVRFAFDAELPTLRF